MPVNHEVLSNLSTKLLENSYILDKDILQNLNSQILEANLYPHPSKDTDFDSLHTDYKNSTKDTGGLFDSIIDLENPEKGNDVSLESRNNSLNKQCGMLKNERKIVVHLLTKCDQERVLFRKLNLELLKLVAELKVSDSCEQAPALSGFIGRVYSLNYELLKKTHIRLETKLLSTEKEYNEQQANYQKLQERNKFYKKDLDLSRAKIKELVMYDNNTLDSSMNSKIRNKEHSLILDIPEANRNNGNIRGIPTRMKTTINDSFNSVDSQKSFDPRQSANFFTAPKGDNKLKMSVVGEEPPTLMNSKLLIMENYQPMKLDEMVNFFQTKNNSSSTKKLEKNLMSSSSKDIRQTTPNLKYGKAQKRVPGGNMTLNTSSSKRLFTKLDKSEDKLVKSRSKYFKK